MKNAVGKATFWAALETGGAQLSSFVFFVVFAHILQPSEFGVYALSMAIVGTVNMVLFQGFGDALIQVEKLEESHNSTVFWTNMALAAGMIAALQVIALLAPMLFGEPMLRPVIACLAFLCIPRALVSVHTALARRTLDLRVFAVRTISGYVAGGVVGLALALAGWGVWAMVVSSFVQSFVIVLVMWRASDWRPRLVFSPAVFRKLLDFSKHFMAASIIRSCIDDFGSVLIGLTLDIVAVGYFALALRVMRSVITLTTTPLQLVMMPALRRFAAAPRRLGAAYTEMVVMASTVWTPAVAGLGLLAHDLLPAVFGPKWAVAVPVLQGMCFAALTLPLSAFAGQALSAAGRPDAFARLAFKLLALYCLVFPVAAQFGVVAVGYAWSLMSAIMVPVALAPLQRFCGVDARLLLAKAARIALAGTVMVGVVLVVRSVLPATPWAMAIEAVAGLIAYAAALDRLFLPGHLARIAGLVRGSIPAFSS